MILFSDNFIGSHQNCGAYSNRGEPSSFCLASSEYTRLFLEKLISFRILVQTKLCFKKRPPNLLRKTCFLEINSHWTCQLIIELEIVWVFWHQNKHHLLCLWSRVITSKQILFGLMSEMIGKVYLVDKTYY